MFSILIMIQTIAWMFMRLFAERKREGRSSFSSLASSPGKRGKVFIMFIAFMMLLAVVPVGEQEKGGKEKEKNHSLKEEWKKRSVVFTPLIQESFVGNEANEDEFPRKVQNLTFSELLKRVLHFYAVVALATDIGQLSPDGSFIGMNFLKKQEDLTDVSRS
jgi:phosphatidylglycerophosphate synthase